MALCPVDEQVACESGICWAHIKSCPRAHTLAHEGERATWSGTVLASGCLDVTKNAPSTVQNHWIEMFGLGHKKFSCTQNATHMFLPENHQYRTQVPLRRRARGAGDSWDVDAGCTLAMVWRGWKIPASHFRVLLLGPPQRCFRFLPSEQSQPPCHQSSGFSSLKELGALSFRS